MLLFYKKSLLILLLSIILFSCSKVKENNNNIGLNLKENLKLNGEVINYGTKDIITSNTGFIKD